MEYPATKPEQYRALGLSTFAFTLCFATWTLFSILGIRISDNLGLSGTQLGLLMATPVLSGSISRVFLGIWTDRYGGRRVLGALMLTTATCVYLLSFADTYPTLLLGALGLGLAGGGFIAGASYTASWFKPAKQGAALGIFGAGNVGAAITSLAAPMLMLALGWEKTAQIYAAILALTGALFTLLAKDDPMTTRRTGEQPSSFAARIAPLKELQVWRFGLYYFFVFGGFVALALWLPHYLMGVYGIDIQTAGAIAALYIVPASLFRAMAGWLADRLGARRLMYWALITSVACTFLLSYPPTRYVVHGTEGDIRFSLEMALPAFIVVIFALGLSMALGKAAVYHHIPAYYPGHVGVVGGVVGMIGGLGGFVLPIGFGVLTDVTGIWQSCFMLMFSVVAAALIWMHYAIRKAERVEWAANEERTDLP